jgi:hypothetical protein
MIMRRIRSIIKLFFMFATFCKWVHVPAVETLGCDALGTVHIQEAKTCCLKRPFSSLSQQFAGSKKGTETPTCSSTSPINSLAQRQEVPRPRGRSPNGAGVTFSYQRIHNLIELDIS